MILDTLVYSTVQNSLNWCNAIAEFTPSIIVHVALHGFVLSCATICPVCLPPYLANIVSLVYPDITTLASSSFCQISPDVG